MRDEFTHCVVCGVELPVKPVGQIPKYCKPCRAKRLQQQNAGYRARRAARSRLMDCPMTLDERANAAKEEGLTYGAYMMKYFPPENMARLPLSHYTGCRNKRRIG